MPRSATPTSAATFSALSLKPTSTSATVARPLSRTSTQNWLCGSASLATDSRWPKPST